MKLKIAFLLSALVVLAGTLSTGCLTTRVDATAVQKSSLRRPIDFGRVDLDALEEAIVIVTNGVRREHGVPEVQPHRALERAARRYAGRMVDKGFLAHIDPHSEKLRTPDDRIRAAGGTNPRAAENIADVPAFRIESGQPFYLIDPEGPVISLEPNGEPVEAHTYASYAAEVVQGWMNSPGHRRNLLDENALEIGVGAAMYRQQHVPSFVVVQKFQLYEPLR